MTKIQDIASPISEPSLIVARRVAKNGTIRKIRTEIERLKKENDGIRCKANGAYCVGYNDAFYDLLAFLDTLPEQPADIPSAGSGAMSTTPPKFKLEVKEQPDCHTVEEWMQHIKNSDQLTKDIFSKGPYDVLYDALNHPYQHCYDAIKEFGELCFQTGVNSVKPEQPVEGLKEAAEKYFYSRWSDGSLDIKDDVIADFIAGAEWMKAKMLEKAVEGEVSHLASVHYVKTNESKLFARLKQFKPGDKVKVIVIPE